MTSSSSGVRRSQNPKACERASDLSTRLVLLDLALPLSTTIERSLELPKSRLHSSTSYLSDIAACYRAMPTATTSFGVYAPPDCPVGATIPYMTPHAVSVSLPKWADNVDYEEGHQRIKDAMSSGYPRFYIHNQIDQVSSQAVSLKGSLELITVVHRSLLNSLSPASARRKSSAFSSRLPTQPRAVSTSSHLVRRP